MQTSDTTPRFRSLSINGTPQLASSTFSFYDKEPEERRDPEKECFMCRQANVYVKPIGMQQERRVARRHPPPLTRAQIDELSEKKHLTKREVRLLLQCYFPEIKHIKYFQLHKYHSCCYDPKHLNLCKNHITALQHEREQYSPDHFHKHEKHEDHLKVYEKENGHQNRVSFVRIKIEPTRGIPTRFLGPTALPESLADMLIKQVNRIENKKKPPSFGPEYQSALEMYEHGRTEQPYGNGISRLSEHLANIDSDNDDDDDDDDDDNNNDDDDDDSGDDANNKDLKSPNSNIRGYHGKVMDRSRMKYERKLQTRQENETGRKDVATSATNGDLVVEDVDEINHLFVNGKEPATADKSSKPLKKKKRKRRSKKRTKRHPRPKLNHWEQLALDHAKQEVCGCRHHVRRLEADQVVYDWCRCKNHLHKEVKEKRKSTPPPPAPPPAPPTPPPAKPKKIKPKVEKRTVGINATEKTTTELALAYDPSTVDYDVIEEVLYYRTSTGRLIKPEITNAFNYTDKSPMKGITRHKSLSKNSALLPVTSFNQIQRLNGSEKRLHKSTTDLSNLGSVANGQTSTDADNLSTNNVTDELMPAYEIIHSSTTPKRGGMYGDDDDDDDDQEETVQFIPPKYVREISINTPRQPSAVPIPLSMQKSSKPTYTNVKPTPNFDRESSIVKNRRWFDQPLGDQNLEGLKDGHYGLIAGTSTEQYQEDAQLPANDYVEPATRRNKSNCTIS